MPLYDTVAAGYSLTNDAMRQMFVSYPEYPERMYLSWGNQGKVHNIFIHGDGRLQLLKWWTLYASATYVIERQTKLADKGLETSQYLQLVASTTFTLPHGFIFTVNCFYNTPMTIGNIKIYPILNINPTIQKSFGKQWNISLGADNLLQRTSKIRAFSSGYDRLTYSKSYATLRLGITYNFNSDKGFRSPRIEKNTDGSRFTKE